MSEQNEAAREIQNQCLKVEKVESELEKRTKKFVDYIQHIMPRSIEAKLFSIDEEQALPNGKKFKFLLVHTSLCFEKPAVPERAVTLNFFSEPTKAGYSDFEMSIDVDLASNRILELVETSRIWQNEEEWCEQPNYYYPLEEVGEEWKLDQGLTRLEEIIALTFGKQGRVIPRYHPLLTMDGISEIRIGGGGKGEQSGRF